MLHRGGQPLEGALASVAILRSQVTPDWRSRRFTISWVGAAAVFVSLMALVPLGFVGTELYLRPKDDLTACFLGEALLPAQFAGGVADCVLGRIAVDDVAYEGHARILLRPEQVQIDAACSGNSDGARWQVEQVDFEGFSSLITIRAIGTTSSDEPPSLTVRGLSTRALERGARVKVTVIGHAHRMPS